MEYVNLKAEDFGVEFNNKVLHLFLLVSLVSAQLRGSDGRRLRALWRAATVKASDGSRLWLQCRGDVIGYPEEQQLSRLGQYVRRDARRRSGLCERRRCAPASGGSAATIGAGSTTSDYTNGVDYPADRQTSVAQYQSSYKLDLASHYQNVQPWLEYEWQPIDGLSITPGYKFVSFIAIKRRASIRRRSRRYITTIPIAPACRSSPCATRYCRSWPSMGRRRAASWCRRCRPIMSSIPTPTISSRRRRPTSSSAPSTRPRSSPPISRSIRSRRTTSRSSSPTPTRRRTIRTAERRAIAASRWS